MSKKSDKCCKKYLEQKRCKKCPRRKVKVDGAAAESCLAGLGCRAF